MNDPLKQPPLFSLSDKETHLLRDAFKTVKVAYPGYLNSSQTRNRHTRITHKIDQVWLAVRDQYPKGEARAPHISMTFTEAVHVGDVIQNIERKWEGYFNLVSNTKLKIMTKMQHVRQWHQDQLKKQFA